VLAYHNNLPANKLSRKATSKLRIQIELKAIFS